MSADVSIEWVPFKVVPQDDQGFEVRCQGELLGGPMAEQSAMTFATELAQGAAAEGKLGIVAQCTENEEIVSVKFYEPTAAGAAV